MTRRHLLPLLAVLGAGLATAIPIGSAGTNDTVALREGALPTIYITYSNNCTFTVTNDSNQRITTIAPGTYNVQISTPSQFNTTIADIPAGSLLYCGGNVNFVLKGPGVDDETTLDDGSNDHASFGGGIFQAGQTYTAIDNNNPSGTRFTFTVATSGSAQTVALPTTAASTTTTSSGSASPVGTQVPKTTTLAGTLAGTVSAAGKLSLTLNGKAATSLKAGRYKLTVADQSAKAAFIIQSTASSGTTVTGAAFTGTKTVTVNLTAGTWFFYPSFVGKKSSLTVHA